MHCVCWFILPLLLPTPLIWFSLVHKRNVSDGVVNGVGRNGNIPIRQRSSDSDSVALMTPLTTPIFDLLLTKGHKLSSDSAYDSDSDSDSVASGNQP